MSNQTNIDLRRSQTFTTTFNIMVKQLLEIAAKNRIQPVNHLIKEWVLAEYKMNPRSSLESIQQALQAARKQNPAAAEEWDRKQKVRDKTDALKRRLQSAREIKNRMAAKPKAFRPSEVPTAIPQDNSDVQRG